MTAMSDVTVLLLTFFMLTSTFVKKEPVQVFTPASVSEIKIPETNILQILVDPQGKIFMSLDKQPDMKAVLEKWVRSTELILLLSRRRICDSFYIWCPDEKHAEISGSAFRPAG